MAFTLVVLCILMHEVAPFSLVTLSSRHKLGSPEKKLRLRGDRNPYDDEVTEVFRDLADEFYPPRPEENVARFRGISFVRVVPMNELEVERRTEGDADDAVVLLLPGIDGQSSSLENQLTNCTLELEAEDGRARRLSTWRMTIGPDDRSSFRTILGACVDFLESRPGSEHIVAGESFGGLTSLALAASNRKTRDGRMLIRSATVVNPATSFSRSFWSVYGPALSLLPKSLYEFAGGLSLLATVPDSHQFERLSIRTARAIASGELGPQNTVNGVANAISSLGSRMPADAMLHRLDQWIFSGTRLVNARVKSIDTPIQLIVGKGDRLIPSGTEGKRLQQQLPNSTLLELEGTGHVGIDDRVDLLDILRSNPALGLDTLRETPVIKARKTFSEPDPVYDWTPPNATVVAEATKNVLAIRNATSPVFMSVDPENPSNVLLGLSGVPDTRKSGRPILFVGNHQLFGLDLGLLLYEFINDRDLIPRGLAHPVVAGSRNQTNRASSSATQPQQPQTIQEAVETGLRERQKKQREARQAQQALLNNNPRQQQDLFKKFGAVEVTPRNFYKLLQKGEAVLLFPGGVREVYHGRDEAYKLFWPTQLDFVRLASRFNATIVPFGAVGSADSFNFVFDADELVTLPFIGDRLKNSTSATPIPSMNEASERAGENEDAARFNRFIPPFALPKPTGPERAYFLFGPAIETADIAPNDKQKCEELYQSVRRNVETNIDCILKAREEDPYRQFLSRTAYKGLTGKDPPPLRLETLERKTPEE